jgi:hypothetical protein
MKRPLGANPEDLIIGNTTGGDLMFSDTLKEYVGEYHVYKNGAVYSNAEYNPKTSKQLMPLIKPLENPICQTYLKLSKKLFSAYVPPTQHFKIIDAAEYQVGKTERYIIQKINEPHKLFEVDADTYKSWNKLNQKGVNGFIYRRLAIPWTIVGDTDTVRRINSDTIVKAELVIPGLGTYLLTNPLEFVRFEYTGGNVNGLFTSGGEFTDQSGNNYVGLYHYHETLGPMEGPTHTNKTHKKLIASSLTIQGSPGQSAPPPAATSY